MKLGPSAFYVSKLDYDVDPAHHGLFLESVRSFMPLVEPADVEPDMAGIRPKLQGEGEGFRDFVIRREEGLGLPGLINLVGIESPGLTAAPAIGELVARMLEDVL